MTLKERKDKLLTIVLARTGGNRKEAAKLMGVHEHTVHSMINERRIRKHRKKAE